MEKYHKIQTIYKRNPEDNYKTLTNEFACDEFTYLAANEWVLTEKVDGTNIRVQRPAKGFMQFNGKTDRAQIPGPLYSVLTDMFLGEAKETEFYRIFPDGDVCLYGEGYGPKIQNGGKYRDDPSFVLFDIRVGRWWLRREDVDKVANILGLNVVPVLGTGTLFDAVAMTKAGFKSRWGDFIAEGIVARPLVEMTARNGSRIITKIKHSDFTKGK